MHVCTVVITKKKSEAYNVTNSHGSFVPKIKILFLNKYFSLNYFVKILVRLFNFAIESDGVSPAKMFLLY